MQENEYLEFLSKHGYDLSEENLITLNRFLEAIINAAQNVVNNEAPVREAVKSFSMEFIEGSTIRFPDLTKSIPTFVVRGGRMMPLDEFRKDD